MRRNTRLWRRDSFLQFYIRAITANEWLDWKLRTIILSQDQKYIAFSSGPILFRTSALLLSDSVMILSLTTSMFPAAGCCLAELQQGARALCPCPLGAGPRWTRRRSGRQTPPSPPAPSCPSWTPLLALAGQPEQQGGRGTQGSCRLTLAPSRATHGQLVGGMVVVLLLARRPPQHWLRTAPASNCCLSSLLRCVRYVHYARTQTGNSRLKFGKLTQALDCLCLQMFFFPTSGSGQTGSSYIINSDLLRIFTTGFPNARGDTSYHKFAQFSEFSSCCLLRSQLKSDHMEHWISHASLSVSLVCFLFAKSYKSYVLNTLPKHYDDNVYNIPAEEMMKAALLCWDDPTSC